MSDLEPDFHPFDAAVERALRADPGPDQTADVGAWIMLDGAASEGAVQFQWDFGDGRRWETPRAEAEPRIRYEQPGRYRATLTVYGADGRRRAAAALLTVTHPPRHLPRQSSSLTAVDARTVAALSTDGATLTLVDTETLALRRRATCPAPRRLAALEGRWLAVTCPDTDTVELHDLAGDGVTSLPLDYGAAPFGIVAEGGRFYVTLQAKGAVLALDRIADRLQPGPRFPVGPDLRGLAALPDGRLAVTRWRSSPDAGELWALDPATGARTPWLLAYDPQAASDTEIGGVPTWLDSLAVSPVGDALAVPGLQANVDHGAFLNGEPLDFDLAVRAVVAFLDPATGEERFQARKQFDGRGLASAAAYSPRGDFLYVATRGSRTVERLDRLVGTPAGTLLDVGFTPEALLVHGGQLWIDAALSRELVIYPLDDFSPGATPRARLPLVDAEPLPPALLLGKRLFNDSADPRLSRDGYLACAHCHLDGDSDRLVWDFTDRGEGLRNTISLRGRAGLAHGPLHWSANFDEVQDFEHDLRGPFAGEGLMSDPAFAAADHPLGPPKAGASRELDALAAYVTSLEGWPRSPHRSADGAFTPAAARGAALFAALDCAACHPPPHYTDSGLDADGAPRLHAIDTLGPGSGQRLSGPLPGIDTPTLHGLWDSAPYLHDGSAPDLAAVLQGRGPADPHAVAAQHDPEAQAALIAFLLSLDGPEEAR